MNQFKDVILGNHPAKYKRVADSQKCLRVSGKHNDLEEVGHDTYHRTMFEMLGNWSFGDYFKKDAIEWAWEYLVEVLKLDPNRLYATVFEGNPQENLERDNEAAAIWGQFLPADKLSTETSTITSGRWADTGPCGPCSEIHIDLRSDAEREAVSGLTLVNQSHPQVIEIWNLVFMQYNRKADGSLEGLPAKVIDTGMGFERLCMALQQKTSNYDTDVFQPIIKEIAQMAGIQYGADAQSDIAMRVIADHIRTISFSITDGQLPSNAKAGYVIRRILRRAVRYGYTFLNQKQAFMYKLLPVLISNMGDAYPELVSQKGLIEKVIKEEEESFLRTLETGIRLLDKTMSDAKAAGQNVINGKDVFTLYDTFGFPLDLTELILRENGMTPDIEEFHAEMQKQKERARNAAAVETGDWIVLKEGTTTFVGYDYTEYEVSILRYRQVKQKSQTLYQLVLDYTPFYAESGGQVGDTGVIVSEFETLEIIDTKKENNLPVHIAKKLPEQLDAPMMACVDTDKRAACAANHSATHLLDEALREVLGEHVEQKGSLVTPDSLRFDFSHFQKVTDKEIREVEHLVNAKIRQNIPLTEYRNIPIAEAKELGAIALFGEKYGDEVRVIQFGKSVEFCGGTHVKATGHIGMMKIVSESSVAAGVRRIEAYTGARVEEMLDTIQDTLTDLKALFNNAPDLANAIRKYIDENAGLKKQVDEFMKEKEAQIKQTLLKNIQEINGIKVIKTCMPIPAEAIKNIAFQLRGEITENLFFVAGTVDAQKPLLTVMLSDNLVAGGLNAGKLVKDAAKLIQGGGGGQAHFATAGGKNVDGLHAAVDKVIELAGI
ncbi:MAG: alanine--tRNA ligase [Bacteroides graminisolvens]